MKLETIRVLIVEDGDEYLENLSRFVPGPHYLQAHSGAEAISLLEQEQVHVVYLDMRFDRIPKSNLLGDHAAVTRDNNGDPARAWRHLMNNQGLYMLYALARSGLGDRPIVLAYDFSFEMQRFKNLARVYPSLVWVTDAVTPGEIKKIFEGFDF
jgi:CheY-like chemotaxis protein